MALEKKLITIPLGKGIETKEDPKQVPTEKLLVLRNGVFISPNRIRKRNGYDSLSTAVENPSFIIGPGLQATEAPGAPPPVVVNPPNLVSITVTTGDSGGGTATTLNGTDFLTGAIVTIGGVIASQVSLTTTSIAVLTPVGSAGAKTVRVTNPDGQFDDLVGAFTYTVPPPSNLDTFGVTMINPTKIGGQTWFMNMSDPNGDSRMDPQGTLVLQGDGSWRLSIAAARVGIYTTSGFTLTDSSTQDRTVLKNRGYMQSTNDWRNIEITGFVKCNGTVGGGNPHFTWYARGGRHTASSPCEGSSYKFSVYPDGRVRWQKESWHVSYEQQTYLTGKLPAGTYVNKFIGIKIVMRNVGSGNPPASNRVNFEAYINENADKTSWVSVDTYQDTGTWGGASSSCPNGIDGMILSWGGPSADFRWDDHTSVDMKWCSVREIDPA